MRPLALAVGFALALSAAAPAQAQQKRDDRQAEAARRMQQQLQKAQQELAAMRGEKEALEKKLKDQSAELEQQREELPKAQAEAGAERRAKNALRTELDALKAQLAERDKALAEAKARGEELAGKERTALGVIAERDRSVKAYQADLARQNREIVACEAKNAKLYELNVELLDRYRGVTVGDVLARRDPLTGIGNVEVFNVVQEYRDKLEAQRIAPAGTAPLSRP